MLDPEFDDSQGWSAREPTAPELAPPSTSASFPWQVVRVSSDRRRVEDWTLVLSSRGIPSLSRWSDGVFELYVLPAQLSAARVELAAADAEASERIRALARDAALEQRPTTRRAGLGGLLTALALLVFFAVTGPRADGSVWFSAGASEASRVLHGEWWRTVTALTLHADSAHLLSNVGLGTLAVSAVMRSEGVGWGAALVLAAGSAGNLLNAWAQHATHSSVGFSTAVFGAIGILGGLVYMHDLRRSQRLRPAWTALAGSLALLALLGASERSDLFAHLFGGLAGVTLGLAVGWSRWRPRTHAGQWFAGAGTVATVVVAWWVALH
jgi:rhomboid protease GluP